jgi:hypothetical protein
MGRYYAALLVLATLAPGPVNGETADADADEPTVTLSAGTIALVNSLDFPYSVGFAIQGRPRTRWGVSPALGAMFGPDGISFVHADVKRDFGFGRDWVFTPSLGAGRFQNGHEIGVQHHLEFMTGLAVSRQVAGRYKIGLSAYHISNAGLERPNNGTEGVSLFVTMPLSR